MIIDAHCHVWPDSLAAKVIQEPKAGNTALYDGTVSGLLKTMDDAGIDMGVCLGVAQAGRFVERVNDFAGSISSDRLVGFGSVHPDLPVDRNLASLRDNGLKGIKIHPLYQGFGFDHPGLWEILDAVGSEFLIIAHVGAGEGTEANSRGSSVKLRAIIDRFPDLRIIACHFGGYRTLDQAVDQVVGTRVYLETAWPRSLDELPPDTVRSIVADHGPDRVIFGSDWPMTDPKREIAAVRALGLDRETEDGILGGNLARELGL